MYGTASLGIRVALTMRLGIKGQRAQWKLRFQQAGPFCSSNRTSGPCRSLSRAAGPRHCRDGRSFHPPSPAGSCQAVRLQGRHRAIRNDGAAAANAAHDTAWVDLLRTRRGLTRNRRSWCCRRSPRPERGRPPAGREESRRRPPPEDPARLPSPWFWPHQRGFEVVDGCGIAFRPERDPSGRGVGGGVVPCTGDELPRRPPFRHVVLGSLESRQSTQPGAQERSRRRPAASPSRARSCPRTRAMSFRTQWSFRGC
jgi:hypothetical protein